MAAKSNEQKFSADELSSVQEDLNELLSSIDAFMDLASTSGGPERTISVDSLYFVLKPLREKTQGIIDALS